ncbi:hypothetical protein ACFL7D_01515 [candidate division KSB1 bacterium]
MNKFFRFFAVAGFFIFFAFSVDTPIDQSELKGVLKKDKDSFYLSIKGEPDKIALKGKILNDVKEGAKITVKGDIKSEYIKSSDSYKLYMDVKSIKLVSEPEKEISLPIEDLKRIPIVPFDRENSFKTPLKPEIPSDMPIIVPHNLENLPILIIPPDSSKDYKIRIIDPYPEIKKPEYKPPLDN